MHMACQVIIQSWTFSRLVGAFLDLAIAYFLLCCSAIAFFVSKFLSILGLTLPCPCNGLFGYPTRAPCLQRLLVDCPTETISSLQLSVKTKFPFDSILARKDHCQLNLKLVEERYSDDGVLELEGEASYSSFSDPRRSQHSLSASDSFGKFDVKAKGAATQRPRCGLRRRRRASIDNGKFTSGSSYDHVRSDARALCWSPSEPSKLGNVENSTLVDSHVKTVPYSESNYATDESKLLYKNATSLENLKKNVGCGHGIDGENETAIRILELALEEEQAASAALCSELEQERLAAATAADEAMAMISRIQEEKASVEIEARQYQRIFEEKSVYDAEEMDILKEIIIRRERENLILEKEIEAYRKVFQENGGLEIQSNDTQGDNEASILDSSVDPMLILQQLSESIDKQKSMQKASNNIDYSSVYVHERTSTVSKGKESSLLQWDQETKIIDELESPQSSSITADHLQSGDEANQDIQEKGMLSMDEIPCPQLCESSSSIRKNNKVSLQQQKIRGVVNYDDGEPRVHDVHIIDSKCSISQNSNRVEGELPFWAFDSQKMSGSADNSQQIESEMKRTSSDIVDRFPTVTSSPDRTIVPELRRNSLSAVDQERLKIDNEIGWLRARLRAVQEEKEKLRSSFEHQERGKTELQLLEDITGQLQEIRHLTAPEKAARQASLPPLSSKVTSKKRRSRSVSVGIVQSESS
ncbi:uncharacterized protein LOC104889811 isoform X2 [Beta vulgaris subsp. vulgaris]|uniref:uncharacterized protein LOC104889811 isoform X2 n=1 Tax=Beta vulgaris subsp. vulgaris TaxID=3555 RepID=UPI002036FA9C|nr:uncharacterized protein LOC104889811 isoform X2 [Beta vulgaris subsp. vulgaris]